MAQTQNELMRSIIIEIFSSLKEDIPKMNKFYSPGYVELEVTGHIPSVISFMREEGFGCSEGQTVFRWCLPQRQRRTSSVSWVWSYLAGFRQRPWKPSPS